ncbi:MAG: hypothetical protein FJ399_14435 [Verrucomicrobia bacterium]|nr:hypothetical protein [Verrucomicrobiota bacterium]
MIPRARRILAGALALAALATAEEPPGPAVELPPMIGEEAATLPPWLYVRTEDTEYLSRCKEATTRGYVEMARSRMRWVRSLFPEEMLARSDVPGVAVLASQRSKSAANAEVIGEELRAQDAARAGDGYIRTKTAPNMMLIDADAIGVFAYIDEWEFDCNQLTISSDYVRHLLMRRTPAPPAWLIDGMMTVYNAVLFRESPITLAPLAWHSVEEVRALAKDSGAARTLLPMSELISGTGGAALHPRIARAQSALVVRWALDPRNGVREAFWKFAVQSAAVPASEAMFQACLGFGYADWRDRVSDYLPAAVREHLRLELEKSLPSPPLEIRRATPNEIARLRGEWERLAVPLVRHHHPAHAVRYLEQARRTLRRAHDAGDSDPRLFASLGLCEIDAGEPLAARGFLESAVAAGVARPRAAYELARLRWSELNREAATARRTFTAEEIARVLAPLRAALDQSPLLVDAVGLWADAWARTSALPGPDDVRILRRGAEQFVADPKVALRVARALGRHGMAAAAKEVLGAGFLHQRDDAVRAQFAQMFAALNAPARRPE